MNIIMQILGFLALCALAIVLAAVVFQIIKSRRLTSAFNIAEGTHEGAVTRQIEAAAITTRHLLHAQGTAETGIVLADATTPAIGAVNDEGAIGDSVTVELLGGPSTRLLVASEVITVGTHYVVYQAAGGKVATTGTIAVGVPLTSAAGNNSVIEVATVPPVTIASPGIAASTFNAHTILQATTDNTPAALTVGEQSVVGRVTSGNIVALTAAQLWTILNDAISSRLLVATPVAAAGSTVADAGQLGTADVVFITSDGAAKGVKLPTGVAGMVIEVVNNSSTAAELYAASGGTVNGGSADASVVVPASKGLRCICTAADTWIAFDMAAKASAS
jgi:hypothetical protein